jgi:hypothetical protein
MIDLNGPPKYPAEAPVGTNHRGYHRRTTQSGDETTGG